MKFIKRLALTLGLIIALLSPVVAAQDINREICRNRNPVPTFCEENQVGQSPSDNRIYGPNGIITNVVRVLSLVIGAAAVIMIIIGGMKYITSSGNPESVNNAKNTILYAIIGLIIAVLAQAIIIFVISNL